MKIKRACMYARKYIEISFFFFPLNRATISRASRRFLKQSTRCKLREPPVVALSARNTLLGEKREVSRREYKASRQRRRKAFVVWGDSHRRLLLHNFTVARAEKTERLSLFLSFSSAKGCRDQGMTRVALGEIRRDGEKSKILLK